MSRSAAWFTIFVAFVLGVGAAAPFARGAAPVLQLATACLLLGEAEGAGHLDAEKRRALIAKMKDSPALAPKDQAIVANLAEGCPKGL